MTVLLSETFETIVPTEADTQLAREFSRRLAGQIGKKNSVSIQVLEHGKQSGTVAACFGSPAFIPHSNRNGAGYLRASTSPRTITALIILVLVRKTR